MMNDDSLSQAATILASLDSQIEEAEPCNMFLKASLNNDEVVLEGNAEGLVTLASMLIDLAAKRKDGSHSHIDKNSILDEGNCKLVVSYSSAPWES